MSSNPSDGWCPFATRYPTSKYWSGNQGRRAVVMHIAQGSYEAAVSWLSSDSNPNSSAHFVIAKNGRIAQLVSIWDSAWANGLRWSNGKWYTPASPPREEHPSWVDIIPGVNPNLYTISVEHEGYYQDRWTPEMYAANTRLLKWIATQIGSESAPLIWVPHRNLIGHYEIDPLDRANCPGPTVNFTQMALDANANANDLFGRIIPQTLNIHIYGTTPLVSLPGYTVVKQLTEVDLPVAGYLDYQGTRWYISQYSYQNRILNFFDSSSTSKPLQDLTASLALESGARDQVMPPFAEIQALAPNWVRVFLFARYQNTTTGQNSDLDWLLNEYHGVKVLVVVNTETVGQDPPPHGSAWGDANTGYIGTVSGLAAKIAGFYKDRIGAIQIWNEPDVQGIAAEDYGAMLKACYPQIKAVSKLPVISAGICCGENLDYLRKVAAVARGSFDFAGWHAYAERLDGYPFATFGFGELRNSLASARTLAGKPLWLTETGARLDWTWLKGMAPADAVADYLSREFALIKSLGRNTVDQAFWFTWREASGQWGLVDANAQHRPAWASFQKVGTGKAITAPPQVTGVSLTPSTVQTGQILNVQITVRNDSSVTLATQGPDPGFVYSEGEDFRMRGFSEQKGSFRVAIDFDGRTNAIDHPYRWGLGAPLPPGATATIAGQIKLITPSVRNYWAGLVNEFTEWVQDDVGTQRITVMGTAPSGQPTITDVVLSPASIQAGGLLTVSITVRNDSPLPLNTQDPQPGFTYDQTQSFSSLGLKEVKDAIRVGVDFDGRSGIDHPYRWGLGSPLGPGESRLVNGFIRLNTAQSRNFWVGLVREQIAWLQDHQGTVKITVSTSTPPPGPPTITAVTIRPTTISQGQLIFISATVQNSSTSPMVSEGPAPDFIYNEGDNFYTKQYPPVAGAWRIGMDYQGRTGVDHPYRWGLGSTLAPGKSTTVTGYVRLNRKQTTPFWIGLIQESVALVQDNAGTTTVTVEQA